MENENKKEETVDVTSDKEECAKKLAMQAEKALKFLKLTVIATAVCAVLLTVVSVILLLTVKGISAAITIGVALGLFVAMLVVLSCVFVYVRGKIKKLKELDSEQNL